MNDGVALLLFESKSHAAKQFLTSKEHVPFFIKVFQLLHRELWPHFPENCKHYIFLEPFLVNLVFRLHFCNFAFTKIANIFHFYQNIIKKAISAFFRNELLPSMVSRKNLQDMKMIVFISKTNGVFYQDI